MKGQYLSGLRMVGVCLLLSISGMVNAAEPNKMGDIFKEKGFEWLLGSWEAVTDTNEKARANFTMEMDGYVFALDVKVGDKYAYRGIMFYVMSKGAMVNNGIDTRGNVLSGTWEIEGEKLVLKGELTAADGKVYKFVRYLSKADADTMRAVTYQVIEGKPSEESAKTLEFKRRRN